MTPEGGAPLRIHKDRGSFAGVEGFFMMAKSKNLWRQLFALVAACFAALSQSGCDGGGGTPAPPPPSVAVTVAPTSASLTVSSTQQFQANITGSSNTNVTWSVSGVGGGNSTVGTISASGLYTAPDLVPSPSSVTVTATSQADTSKSALATVSLSYPAPSLKTISPESVSVGASATTLSIFGAGLTKGTTVSLGGTSLQTSYLSSTEVTALVPAFTQAIAGTFEVSVANPTPGGGTAGPATFTVSNLVPTLNSISPSTLKIGSPATRVNLTGQFFLPASTVSLDSTVLTTTYVSSTLLVPTVPAGNLTAAGTFNLTVANPAPGGGPSDPLTLTVSNQETIEESEQTRTLDPEAFVYLLGGVASAQSTNGITSSLTAQPGVAPASQTGGGSVAASITNPPCNFDQDSWTTPTAACIGHVAWIGYYPPGSRHCSRNCGVACLVIVEDFWNQVPPAPEQITAIDGRLKKFPGLDQPVAGCVYEQNGPDGGVHLWQLESIATNPPDGMMASQVYGVSKAANASVDDQLSDVLAELKQGDPVIVPVFLNMDSPSPPGCEISVDTHGEPKQFGHFMVLVGMDETSVYVLDPDPLAESQHGYKPYAKDLFVANWQCNGGEVWLRVLPGPGQAGLPLVIVRNTLFNLPSGKAGTPYSATISAQYGTPSYKWSIVQGQGNLPDGLAVDSVSGTISGTPLTQGVFTFTVRVTDAANGVASGVGTITIGQTASPLIITTPGLLPTAQVGVPSSLPLAAAGGAAPFTWVLQGSGLPDGLTLDGTGLISGTPAAALQGSTFTLQAADSGSPQQTATKAMTLTVVTSDFPPRVSSVTANPLTVSTQGTSALTCNASDPEADPLTYTWTATGGTVSGSGANVTWAAPGQPGGYTVTCSVSEPSGQSDSGNVLVSVNSVVLTTSVTPATGVVFVTQFSVKGSGATPNGGVTATITAPDGGVHQSAAVADSTGAYAFSPFPVSQTGIYTEADSDDKTGAQSNTITWTANAPGQIVVNPPQLNFAFGVGDPSSTVGLQVSSGGGTSLNGRVQVTTSSGGNWLTVGGQVSTTWVSPETLSVTATPQGLGAGTYAGAIVLSSQNATNSPVTVPVTMVIVSGLTIITASPLPDAFLGTPYNVQLQAKGGSGAGYLWSVSSGLLPQGLSLSSSTGVISGTPPANGGTGVFNFTVTVLDTGGSHQSASKAFTLTVRQGFTIITDQNSLPTLSAGISYSPANSFQFQATAGTPPYTWSATGLPAGLTLDSNGFITGIPQSSGSFNILVTVTDSTGLSVSRSYTLQVSNAIPLQFWQYTANSLPTGTVGLPYAGSMYAIGGTEVGYVWTLVSGNMSLPPGITFQMLSVQITGGSYARFSGTPTVAGSYTFSLKVTDSAGASLSGNFTIIINPVPTTLQITTTSSALPTATIGTPYSYPLQASGGTGTGYKWAFVSNSPDPGLTLSVGGLLSGTPTTFNECGTSVQRNFTVEVTDSGGSTATQNLCLNEFYPTPQITSLSPASRVIDGNPFTLTVTGTNFLSSSQIVFAYVPIPTNYVSSTTLTANFVSSPYGFDPGLGGAGLGAGTYAVKIQNPGGDQSAPANFTIYNPPPVITSVSSVGPAGAPCITNEACSVVLTGSGFLSSSTVVVNGTALSLSSSNTATPPFSQATYGAFTLTSPGTYTVTVTNTDQPGGGSATATATFTVSQ